MLNIRCSLEKYLYTMLNTHIKQNIKIIKIWQKYIYIHHRVIIFSERSGSVRRPWVWSCLRRLEVTQTSRAWCRAAPTGARFRGRRQPLRPSCPAWTHCTSDKACPPCPHIVTWYPGCTSRVWVIWHSVAPWPPSDRLVTLT